MSLSSEVGVRVAILARSPVPLPQSLLLQNHGRSYSCAFRVAQDPLYLRVFINDLEQSIHGPTETFEGGWSDITASEPSHRVLRVEALGKIANDLQDVFKGFDAIVLDESVEGSRTEVILIARRRDSGVTALRPMIGKGPIIAALRCERP